MRAKTSLFAAAALLLGIAAAGLPAGPASAAALPDVALSGAFDKTSYAVGEHFTVAVTATNHSSVPATGVHYTGGDSDGVDGTDYGVLSTGFNLAPGETKVINITGVTTEQGQKYGRAYIAFDAEPIEGDADLSDNTVLARTTIPGAFGDIHGLIFPGDTLESTPVPGQPGLASQSGAVLGQTTTGTDGRFSFAHVAPADVWLRLTPPPGWEILYPEGEDAVPVQVIGDETADLQIVAKAQALGITSKVVSLANPTYGTTELYARRDDGHLNTKAFTNGWSAWSHLGGSIASDPAVLYSIPLATGTQVYARSATGALVWNRKVYTNWTGWSTLAPSIKGTPTAIFNPHYGTIEVYFRTLANTLGYLYYNNGWSAVQDLGGNLAGDPAVIYNPTYGTTEAYVRISTGAIAYKYYLGGWSGWNNLGGTVTGTPSVIYNPHYGTTEVYTRTSTNALNYKYYLGGWSGWNNLGGTLDSNPAVIYNPRVGTTEAYVRTPANTVEYRYYLGGWSGWNNLQGSVAGTPSVIYNPHYATTEVYSRTPAGSAVYKFYNNGWSAWNDLP